MTKCRFFNENPEHHKICQIAAWRSVTFQMKVPGTTHLSHGVAKSSTMKPLQGLATPQCKFRHRKYMFRHTNTSPDTQIQVQTPKIGSEASYNNNHPNSSDWLRKHIRPANRGTCQWHHMWRSTWRGFNLPGNLPGWRSCCGLLEVFTLPHHGHLVLHCCRRC